MNFFYYLCT